MASVAVTRDAAIVALEKIETPAVVWMMTSREREERMLPVRIPLLKGLLGHRVFIIREEDRDRFAAVDAIEDLQQMKAGQGTGWADSEILRANRLPVVEVAGYESLFF